MISGSTDIRSLAVQFMQADRASQDQIFNSRKQQFEGTLKLYSAMTSKINEFRDTLRTFAKNKEFEAYSVTQSVEGYAGITASGAAAAGQHKLHIEKLASAQQVALSFASETDPMPTSGVLNLGVGAKSFSIDMSKLPAGADLTTLRDAINSNAANPGVKASIVRTSGSVKLLIGSAETGAANTLSMSTDGTAAMANIQTAINNRVELSKAQDAVIYLGDTQSLKLTSATNTFTNVLDGVTIDLKKAHATVGETLTFTIAQDSVATKEKLQKLVDGYNSIIDSVAKNSGGNNANSRMLLQQLRSELSVAGASPAGLEFDRGGKLSINSKRMETFLKNNPDGLTQLFSGTGGVIEKLSMRADTFTKGETSLLQSSSKSVRSSLEQLESRMDRFDRRMEQTLNRYIAQFSQMQTLISKMEQTSSLF